MGKWCLHASLFIFDRIIIKVAGNQDRHKSSVKFDFGPNQTTHFGVTCPWVTKIHTFELECLWSQLVNIDQILCVASSGWGKGCIGFGADWLGTLHSGERSLPFGLLVFIWAATWQNQQNDCAPNEDADQPGQLPSLIRVFAVCLMGS